MAFGGGPAGQGILGDWMETQEQHDRREAIEKYKRHAAEAIEWAAEQKCIRSNCGTVCLCGPCHARKVLEIHEELS